MTAKIAETEPLDPTCVDAKVVEGVYIKRRAGGMLEYQFWEMRDICGAAEKVVVHRIVWLSPLLAEAANRQIRLFLENSPHMLMQ